MLTKFQAKANGKKSRPENYYKALTSIFNGQQT